MDYYLFTTDPAVARLAEAAGIDGLVVDWENRGKEIRQQGYDCEVNLAGAGEVRAVARASHLPVLVRINALGEATTDEVQTAIEAGAREIMLPMATHPDTVEQFLGLVAGRARTVVQIETQDLVENLEGLRDLPWSRAYIGLNDLMISRGGGNSIWDGVADGTVERIFERLPGRVVGFGGITVLGGGHPVPFDLLFGEMVRLGCGLSFLRRTFYREIADRDMNVEIPALRTRENALRMRAPEQVESDLRRFRSVLQSLSQGSSE